MDIAFTDDSDQVVFFLSSKNKKKTSSGGSFQTAPMWRHPTPFPIIPWGPGPVSIFECFYGF
jgi:hypothetical protein